MNFKNKFRLQKPPPLIIPDYQTLQMMAQADNKINHFANTFWQTLDFSLSRYSSKVKRGLINCSRNPNVSIDVDDFIYELQSGISSLDFSEEIPPKDIESINDKIDSVINDKCRELIPMLADFKEEKDKIRKEKIDTLKELKGNIDMVKKTVNETSIEFLNETNKVKNGLKLKIDRKIDNFKSIERELRRKEEKYSRLNDYNSLLKSKEKNIDGSIMKTFESTLDVKYYEKKVPMKGKISKEISLIRENINKSNSDNDRMIDQLDESLNILNASLRKDLKDVSTYNPPQEDYNIQRKKHIIKERKHNLFNQTALGIKML